MLRVLVAPSFPSLEKSRLMTTPTTSSQPPTNYRRKLIEVALPLEDINRESAREKSIRHGHPSTLHLWWARRPLAAARAVLFGQMVDDPSGLPEEYPTEEAQTAERERLFEIIRALVKWENTTKEEVLHPARVEIARSAARNHGVSLPRSMTPAEVADALRKYAPPVLDPFAGGGSIPLEAQRLGLEAHASDLNPVAVLINKAMIEIPPKFAGRPPVHPNLPATLLKKEWKGAEGLAEDARYYGQWMRDEAFKRIGHLYPKVTLPKEQGGGEATVIAWLWARTVMCPNPACGARMPLVKSFELSKKKGRETKVIPVADRTCMPPKIRFEVVVSTAKATAATIGRNGGICLVCGAPASLEYIREEGQAGRIGSQLMAIVGDSKGGRVYLSPNAIHEAIAAKAEPDWGSDAVLSTHPQYMAAPRYGMTRHRDLFSPRQLTALDCLSELCDECSNVVYSDANGDQLYANAIVTYLAMAIDRLADSLCTLATWQSMGDFVAHAFARQALSMVWDFAEVNPFSDSTRNFLDAANWVAECIEMVPSRELPGTANQQDAALMQVPISSTVFSTDPPYYDNVPYADLADFFYVWLRRCLGSVYPDLFATVLVPKSQELVADVMRHGGREPAQRFFEDGLGKVFKRMHEGQSQAYPLTVYYAFKQTEDEGDSDNEPEMLSASTGWETMLEGLLKASFSIDGTWPMRTERGARTRSIGSNALASSIILVCRPRSADAEIITRRDFLGKLKRELPSALKDLQRGNIAPVDLAQASIGPGMAVFSRYSRVLESDGSPMRVRTALQLINQTLDEALAEQEGEYDADTRWAVAWFEQYGMNEGPYGVAETLSKAKNSAVGALVEDGILEARGGKVRLLKREELAAGWNPATAKRLTVWEVTQRLIYALQEDGEQGAAAILDHVGGMGDIARDLAYRLYTVCERKKWADEALAYNSLVVEWTGISGAVERLERTTATQQTMF